MSAGDAGRLSEADIKRVRSRVLDWLVEDDADDPDEIRDAQELSHKIARNLAPVIERIVADRLAARQAPPGGVEAVLAEHVPDPLVGWGCSCGWSLRFDQSDVHDLPGRFIRLWASHVAAALAPVLAAERAAGAREGMLGAAARVQYVYDLQCPPMASRNYIAGAYAAHQWWSTVLGGTLREIRLNAGEDA